MHLCKPLPDEHARGHLVRLQLLNGLEDQYEVARALGLLKRSSRHEGSPLIDTLARIADLDTDRYLHAHTFLPYWIFFRGRNVTEHGSRWSVFSRGQHGFAIPPSSASFCPSCSLSDFKAMGFSYWRRSHQIPGMVRCNVHDKLFAKATQESFRSQLPHHLLGDDMTPSQAESFDDENNQFVIEYQMLAEAVLESSITLAPDVAAQNVRTLVRSALPDMTPNHSSKELAIMSENLFPIPWLDMVFRRTRLASQKVEPNPFQGLTSELASLMPTVESSMMALIMLFGDARKCYEHLVKPDGLRPSTNFLRSAARRGSNGVQSTGEALDV